MSADAYLTELPDGTVKQRNPFTGTEVWTVPGRGNRPLGLPHPHARSLTPSDLTHACAFCVGRYLETPPEKSRVLRDAAGWRVVEAVQAHAALDTVAEFRRVPNLFEILGYEYWNQNHGFTLPAAVRRRRDVYLASAEGRAHVAAVMAAKLRASGLDPTLLPEDHLLERATGFFGGGHDVIIARRHFVDDATTDAELASSGTLTPDEHARFIAYAADAARDGYAQNRHARYVVVFQNWLRPAGASFDHLHKQVVAVDEVGGQQEAVLRRVADNPNVFNDDALNVAVAQGLVIAANAHCIAFAGFGHRYPTIEVYSTSATCEPWSHTEAELRGVSDVLHAVHAALGADVPCNEEWHYRPAGVTAAMPWRIMVKLRVSTLAGFEGATKLYLNTVAPATLRERLVPRLLELRATGTVSGDLAIGGEADIRPDPLPQPG